MGIEYKEDEYESLFMLRDLSLYMNERLTAIHGKNSETLELITGISEEKLEEIMKEE